MEPELDLDLDVSNHPEIERLGANVTAQHALRYWNDLTDAARLDGRDLDPLWEWEEEAEEDGAVGDSDSGKGLPRTSRMVVSTSRKLDDRLYAKFRSNFAALPVSTILPGTLTSPPEKWRNLCEACNGLLDDYNFMTLLRPNYVDIFWMTEVECCDGLLIVPRVQFVFVELARCREGCYGAQFRRVLQTWDLKCASEALQQQSCCGSSSGDADASASWGAIRDLQGHWPHPHRSALIESGAGRAVRFASTHASTPELRAACAELVTYWRDLLELGRVGRSLSSSSAAAGGSLQQLDALRHAAHALVLKNTQSASSGLTGRSSNVASSGYDAASSSANVSVDDLCISDMSTQRATDTFHKYGLSYLSSPILTPQQISSCRQHAQTAYQDLIDNHLTPRGLTVQDEFDFWEVRHRPGNRLDNRYKISEGYCGTVAGRHETVQRLVRAILLGEEREGGDGAAAAAGGGRSRAEGDVKLLYCGVVHSFPRSRADSPFAPSAEPEPQVWHRDTPSLFAHKTPHPTHCINVFIPLVDVTPHNGGTEFVPYTQQDSEFERLAPDVIRLAERDVHARHDAAVRPSLPAGSVLMFDARLMHRGLANTSEAERPMLYFTFALDWWDDGHMFQSSESLLETSRRPSSSSAVVEANTEMAHALYEAVTGHRPPPPSPDGAEYYGHPHYTTRFDLMLIENWNSTDDDDEAAGESATVNAAAIMKFINLTEEGKMSYCRDVVDALARPETRRLKMEALAAAGDRRRAHRQQKTNGTTSSLPRRPGNEMEGPLREELVDFTSIETDMSDVSTLYNLVSTVILESPLSSLGFAPDQNGTLVMLAVVKAYRKAHPTSGGLRRSGDGDVDDDEGAAAATFEMIEEAWTSFWHAGTDRFAFRPGSATTEGEKSKRCVLVVFSSLGSGIARPEWGSSLHGLAPQAGRLDVLNVLDPAFSWYNQDPSVAWEGLRYYSKELQTRLRGYRRVMFLGDSMGAAACLAFSRLADAVLAFTPQVDVTSYEAITRLDFPPGVLEGFANEVISAVSDTSAAITIHLGRLCEEDLRQVSLLPRRSNVVIVEHDYDDHILSLHLRDRGKLKDIVTAAVESFVSADGKLC